MIMYYDIIESLSMVLTLLHAVIWSKLGQKCPMVLHWLKPQYCVTQCREKREVFFPSSFQKKTFRVKEEHSFRVNRLTVNVKLFLVCVERGVP